MATEENSSDKASDLTMLWLKAEPNLRVSSPRPSGTSTMRKMCFRKSHPLSQQTLPGMTLRDLFFPGLWELQG